MTKHELSHPLPTNPEGIARVYILTQTDRYGKTTVLNAGTSAFVEKQRERCKEMDLANFKHYEYAIHEQFLYHDNAEPITMKTVQTKIRIENT